MLLTEYADALAKVIEEYSQADLITGISISGTGSPSFAVHRQPTYPVLVK